MMLPGWIIEQLEKNKKAEAERPSLRMPRYDERESRREEQDEPTSERGVFIINIAGDSEEDR